MKKKEKLKSILVNNLNETGRNRTNSPINLGLFPNNSIVNGRLSCYITNTEHQGGCLYVYIKCYNSDTGQNYHAWAKYCPNGNEWHFNE